MKANCESEPMTLEFLDRYVCVQPACLSACLGICPSPSLSPDHSSLLQFHVPGVGNLTHFPDILTPGESTVFLLLSV